jgi:MFS family permease
VLACHAASSDFTGIMVTRFFLGMTEAAISPGFSLITGMWYTREEQPLRHGLWFAGNSLATAFGGLVAYGVAQITGSISAWKVSFTTILIIFWHGFSQPDASRNIVVVYHIWHHHHALDNYHLLLSSRLHLLRAFS